MQQNPERLGVEKPKGLTAEVQGNYPNFKTWLKKKFCHLKKQQKPALVAQMPFQSSKVAKVSN